MAQATLVWQLSRRLAPVEVTPAQRLIEVYGSYRWLEPSPIPDSMAVAFVPHLLAQARTCGQCGIAFCRARGEPAKHLLGLPALSAPPVSALRRAHP